MRALPASVSRWWGALWFVPDSARNIAFIRIVVAVHALWMVLSRDFAAISGHTAFWSTVPSTAQWRFLLFPGHAALEHAVQWTAIAALVCAILGVYPRIACFVGGILLYHLAPLETIIWSPTPFARGLTLTPLVLVIIGCVPFAGGFGLWPRVGTPAVRSWEFGWPRRLTWLLVAQVYLFAAYSKAQASGFAWSSADSIRRWLLFYAADDRWRYREFGEWLAGYPAACLAIGAGTVILEWSFVLAVFSRVARLVLVPLMMAFQIGVFFAMSIHVGETWLMLTFLDFDRIVHWLTARSRPADEGLVTHTPPVR